MALRASCTVQFCVVVGMRHTLAVPFTSPSDLIPWIPIPVKVLPPSNLPNATSDLALTTIGMLSEDFCSEAFALSIESAVLAERILLSLANPADSAADDEEEAGTAMGLVGGTPELRRYFEIVSKLNL